MSKQQKRTFVYLWIMLSLFLLGSLQISATDEIIFRKPNLPFSDNGIRAITQDYKGFMWFGTESGLNCYDGVNMKIYNKQVNDTNSLINISILSLFESSRRDLWVGTANGICKYNRDRDNFSRYTINPENPSDLNSNYITEIIEDADGDLWLGTRGGVYIYNYYSNKILSFNEFTNSTEPLYKSQTTLIAKANNGAVVGVSSKGALVTFNKQNGKIDEYFFDNGKQIRPLEFESVRFTNTGSKYLWLGTSDKGLIQIKGFGNGSVFFDIHKHDPNNDETISWNSIFSIGTFNDSCILLGSENGGLNVFNFVSNKFYRYMASDDPNQGISGNSIWSIHKDSKDNVWLGIFNHGVNIINKIPQKFKAKIYSVLNASGITNGSVTAFYEDDKGNLWISSDGGGLDYWDRTNDIFTHYKNDAFDHNTLSSNASLCIHEPIEGEIWVGCYNGGVSILKKGQTSFQHINTRNGLSNNNVFSIVQRKNGLVYIGTYGGGVDVCDPKSRKVFPLMKDSVRRSKSIYRIVNVLFVDRHDNLWVGYENGGVDRYSWNDERSYEIEHYQHVSSDPKSLSDNSILVINQDKKGNIWLGTRDGVNVFHEATKDFSTFRISDGLPSNTIVGVIEDNNGKIWLSTLNGLSEFNVEDSSFTNYTQSDGIKGLKFSNRSAVYKNSSGELFFGNNNGFTYFNPDEMQYDRTFPQIYFVNFKLFNKSVEIGSKNSPLPKHLTELTEIKLRHNQSVFTIEYVAINYIAPEKIKYAYRLNGLDNEWNYVGDKREANYTNLDKGSYLFEVKSTNIEGDWNTEIASLKITILPAWYETILVRILFAVFFGLVLYFIYLNRVRGIKNKQKELERKVNERTLELNETNRYLEEINKEVVQQQEEIMSQAEYLTKTNEKLEEKTAELSDHKKKLRKSSKNAYGRARNSKRAS